MTRVRTITRGMSLLAGGALVLTGALVAPLGALPLAQGADLTTSYRMTITNEPANTYGGVNYNYLTYPGFDVFMYNNGYNGTFGDEHLSGITLTLHGQRVAGNGDIHLLPVPEQWDAAAPASSAPVMANGRQYDYATNTITLPMRYRYDYVNATTYRDMRYDLVATPEPGGVVVKVVLQDDLPAELAGSAAFNLEFIPSLYMNKSYQVDTDGNGSYDTFSTLPLAPEDPMDEEWPRPQLAGNAWYVDQWNTEKGDAQPSPLARGYRFNLAPEDDQTHISIQSKNLLSIYDGRNRSQNGWFTMSSKIETGAKAGATVAEWHIQAPVERDWVREPSIAHSQAGYGTGLAKVAVMEIDKNDTSAPNTATLGRLEADGSVTPVFTDALAPAVRWTRYNYRSFDFSSVTTPGIYVLEYDGVRTDVFPIDDNVYDKTWQPALSGYLATAMDHIELREGYKIWHGASHMDDARVGESFQNSVVDPVTNRIPWFDGQQVPMTLPAVVQAKGYGLGDRIPGLDQGGWYDAGDFDIQLASNQSVLRNLINNAETFDNLDDYDTLAVEWNQDTGGTAEMHRPDGVPDVVQQVKHGAMQILANYENVGIVQGTIEVPTLRQYTHLGDGSTDTDGYIYDPSLAENEVVERGGKVYSGVNDDRMLMFGTGAGAATSNLGTVSINLAGAAAVVKQYYPDFANDCLAAAKDIWTTHGTWAMGTAAQRSNAFNTLVQLMLATEGTADYAAYKADMDYLLGLNATPNPNPFVSFLPIQSNVAATFIADLMGPAYTADLVAAAETLAAGNTFNYVAGTPFGFTESLTSGWGPSSGRYSTAATGAYILKNLGPFTGSEKIEQAIIRSVNYIMGTHPYNDTSWLTGVGANSHKMPYNSNRADNGYIPGSLVPGYVSFRPDFPESLDNFQFLWAENEATIGGVSSWIAPAKMAAEIAADAVAGTAPAAATDFHRSFMMEAQETEAVNPYTGAAETPYETLTTPGFDVFMYNTTFSQIFGDQHSAGVELVLNGERIATNGDIHLLPTPEQWDATPAPVLESRSSDPVTDRVSATLTMPATTDGAKPAVRYTLNAEPEPGGTKLSVVLDGPLPPDLAGKAGFNLEFIPELYKEKAYQADADGDGRYDDFGVIPLLPFDDMEVKDRARTDDQAWYVQEWNRDRGDYQPVPIATGKTMTLSPETENRIRVTSDSGDVQLLDGRDRAQNGWFVLRTLFAPGSTEIVWHIQADVNPGWTREPNVGHSQAGYGPDQSKVAVIELDPNFAAPTTASIERVNPNGTYSTVYTGRLGAAKRWLRYDYREFDFSTVKTPGIYTITYAGERTEVFPIADDVYAKAWQQSLTGFLAKEMDHIAVRETYKIVHAASHMDDAIMYPLVGEPFRDEAAFDGTWFDGQDFRETSRTTTQYDSLEHVPGLAVGGWYDAGDYDLEATRQAGVIEDLAIAWREFHPDYDTLDVDWDATTGGMVELHRPDGVPDMVQQVKHGALNVLARLEAIGYNFKVVEVPTLRQYTHLGDGGRETDNKVWDPALAEDEVDGLRSGKQDDRLAMVGEKDSNLQFNAAYSLAAAATVVKGYDDALAAKALTAAKQIWDEEDLILNLDGIDPTDFMAQWQAQSTMAVEWNAAIELLIATGEAQYRDAIEALWPLMKAPLGWAMSFGGGGWKAALVLDHMSQDFQGEFHQAIADYKASYDATTAANPWGVADTIGMWGGSTEVVDTGVAMYFLHKVDPYTIDADYSLRAATYILGTHADNDTSWLSGVGTSSVEKAYGNTRADDTFVAGGIVPGYVPIMPDLPEAKDKFGMMWFESEYVIDTAASWVILGNAAGALLDEDPSTWPARRPVPAPTVTVTETPGPAPTVTVPGPTVTHTTTVQVPGPTVTVPGSPQPGPTVTHSTTTQVPGPTVTHSTTTQVQVPGPSVTVTAPPIVSESVTLLAVQKVKASQPAVRLVKGSSTRLAGYGYTAAGKRVKVSWSSSRPSVAKVSALGKVTGLKAGEATITVKAGGKKTTVKVTVLAKKPSSSSVKSVKATVPKTLAVGAVKEITGAWTPASAPGVAVTYASSKTSVAHIDKAGRIVAKAPGTTKITVKAGGKSKAYTLRVV